MQLIALIAEWQRDARAVQLLAPTTLKVWSAWMRRFNGFAAGHRGLLEFGSPDVDVLADETILLDWVIYLREGGKTGKELACRPRTVRAAFAALRSLVRFALAKKHLAEEAVTRVKMPRMDAPIRRRLSPENMEKLPACCVGSSPTVFSTSAVRGGWKP